MKLPFHKGDTIYNPNHPERKYRVINVNGRKDILRIKGKFITFSAHISDAIKAGYRRATFLLFFGLSLCIISPIPGQADETASWYGGGEKLNKHTANGEVFDPGKLCCACWDYPFGTVLKVTNLANNKFVLVKVWDRGPNRRLRRKIDLTRKAFSEIADLKQGLIKVRIEVMPKDEGGDNANT